MLCSAQTKNLLPVGYRCHDNATILVLLLLVVVVAVVVHLGLTMEHDGRYGCLLPCAIHLPVSPDMHLRFHMGPYSTDSVVRLRQRRRPGHICHHTGEREARESEVGEEGNPALLGLFVGKCRYQRAFS